MFQPLYTAEEMRTAEQGHDVQALMERAGRAVAEAVVRRYPDARRIAGVCGKGANGGDGRIALRLLGEAGRETTEELDGDVDLVVDALFGTGFHGEPRPDQVAVRKQKREREQRQGGETAEVAPDRECEGRAEGQRQEQPRQARAQLPLDRGREEEREEEEIGEPEVRGRRLARNREGEREVREDIAMLVDDHLRRPAPNGVGVDPGNDQGDEHHPAQRLEIAQEPEADRRDAEELAEVLWSAPAREVKQKREHAEREADREQPGCIA